MTTQISVSSRAVGQCFIGVASLIQSHSTPFTANPAPSGSDCEGFGTLYTCSRYGEAQEESCLRIAPQDARCFALSLLTTAQRWACGSLAATFAGSLVTALCSFNVETGGFVCATRALDRPRLRLRYRALHFAKVLGPRVGIAWLSLCVCHGCYPLLVPRRFLRPLTLFEVCRMLRRCFAICLADWDVGLLRPCAS
jgi:hypothetical protein